MEKVLNALQSELDKFIKWNDENKPYSEIANARRNGYRQGLETAIQIVKSNQ